MSYQAKIDVIVAGLRELAATENLVQKLDKSVDRLRKKPIELFSGGRGSQGDYSRIASKRVADVAREFVNGNLKISKSVKGINSQYSEFTDFLASSSIKGKGLFQRQEQGLKNVVHVMQALTRSSKEAARAQENLFRSSQFANQGIFGGTPRTKTTLPSGSTVPLFQTIEQKEDQDFFRQRRLNRLRTKRQRGTRFREDLMLGAGFPLLFGGGLGGVAGGVGGAVFERTRKRPTGGFGAQIFFSAIGQQFDKFIGSLLQNATKLGTALNPFKQNVDTIVQSLGVSGTATEAYIQELKKVEGSQVAMNEALKELTGIVGKKGVNNLKEFGKTSQAIQNAASIIFTKITAGLAGLLVLADKFFKFSTGANKITRESFDKTFTDPRLRKLQLDLTNVSGGKGAKQSQINRINSQIEEIRQTAFEKSQQEVKSDTANLNLEKEIENLKQRMKLGEKNAAIEREVSKIVKERKLDLEDDSDIIKRIRGNVVIKAQLTEQLELFNRIKDIIATGLTSAIEGLIAGTKTLGESLASIAKSIGSMFLQSAISSIVGGINFGGKVPGKMPATTVTVAQGGYMANGIKPFATGGMATRPTLGLVGEAGEDEYIIPASKMSTAMQRYSAGARGQSVIPGTGSSQSGGGGGGSTTVNYSGPILNFNSEEFVPKAAVGAIIASATSQGAAMGETRTIRAMQNRRSIRTRVGI